MAMKEGHRRIEGPLTARQLEVLKLRASGMENPEIMRILGIKRSSLSKFYTNITNKLYAGGIKEAVEKAKKRRLV